MTDERMDSGALVSEGMPSLADVAQESGGAWPAGWYDAEIIAGYGAGGYQFETGSKVSKAGDSFNMLVALKVTATIDRKDGEGNTVAAGATRNTFTQQNYRATDFTAANVARVKAKEFGPKDRIPIVLGKFGQIEKAVGLGWTKNADGQLSASNYVGHKVQVRLTIGEKGFNEVTGFRAVGAK